MCWCCKKMQHGLRTLSMPLAAAIDSRSLVGRTGVGGRERCSRTSVTLEIGLEIALEAREDAGGLRSRLEVALLSCCCVLRTRRLERLAQPIPAAWLSIIITYRSSK